MSFKLQQVSTGGGRGLACKEVIHQDSKFHRNVDKVPLHVCNISSLLRVKGQLEGQHVSCLLDSGAAVSVVRYSALLDSVKGNIRSSNALVVSANGTPLDVMGMITLSVRLGSFLDEHEFIVVKELTV